MLRTVSALSGAVVKPDGGSKESEPAPLRPFGLVEYLAVIMFVLAGALMIYFALHDFQHALSGGKFVSKTITTLPSKQVEETDYSDSFPIFLLTAGTMFILLAGLYGRLRDITLGVLKVELAEEGTPNDAAATPTG